jgi:V/A-type H+-transporting ATPase subunit I
MPADILSQLSSLIGKTYETKMLFSNKVAEVIGSEASTKYFDIINKYSEADWAFLNSFRHLLLDPNKMFYLSLIIGGIQIIFGMFIKAANQIKQYGLQYAYATIGWIFLIVGGLVLTLLKQTGTLNEGTYSVGLYVVLGISALGILLFNNPKRNILVNFGAGIYDTYNMVTGVLGDLLSYIRLFALGISSAILGFVFNDLALNMSPDTIILKQLVFVIILLVGHGINIFMSGLGSFVHPMRLTFVEFYKNAGFSGGGKKYQPFSKQ